MTDVECDEGVDVSVREWSPAGDDLIDSNPANLDMIDRSSQFMQRNPPKSFP